MIFRPCPFWKLPHFLRLLPPLEREVAYFMHGHKTFIKRHSVIQRRSRPKLFRTCRLLLLPNPRALLMFAPQIGHSLPLLLLSHHLSSRRDDLRLSCLLTPSTDAVREH